MDEDNPKDEYYLDDILGWMEDPILDHKAYKRLMNRIDKAEAEKDKE